MSTRLVAAYIVVCGVFYILLLWYFYFRFSWLLLFALGFLGWHVNQAQKMWTVAKVRKKIGRQTLKCHSICVCDMCVVCDEKGQFHRRQNCFLIFKCKHMVEHCFCVFTTFNSINSIPDNKKNQRRYFTTAFKGTNTKHIC